ncbi:MAG: 4-hydroxy-tetrahydrodipicolinate synthase [Fibrobacterota bacterium]
MKTLKGTFTALITPFKNTGEVDFEKLKELVLFQIEKGISGLVPCGTTGESPTLSHKEHMDVVETVIKAADNKVTVIAGAGSNSTSEAVELTRHAKEAGADAVLSVNPYYNKPTQEGLYRHFCTIADTVDIPVVLYNIKGRTAVNVETDTLLRIIANSPGIKAVKEASGDMNQIKEVIDRTPEDFIVLSGDDNLAIKLIKNGGDGVISVASNLLPAQMSEMISSALNGNFEKAEEMHKKLSSIFSACFMETNPIPIKAAMAIKGMAAEIYRLPMCELRPENRSRLEKILEDSGFIL